MCNFAAVLMFFSAHYFVRTSGPPLYWVFGTYKVLRMQQNTHTCAYYVIQKCLSSKICYITPKYAYVVWVDMTKICWKETLFQIKYNLLSRLLDHKSSNIKGLYACRFKKLSPKLIEYVYRCFSKFFLCFSCMCSSWCEVCWLLLVDSIVKT